MLGCEGKIAISISPKEIFVTFGEIKFLFGVIEITFGEIQEVTSSDWFYRLDLGQRADTMFFELFLHLMFQNLEFTKIILTFA